MNTLECVGKNGVVINFKNSVALFHYGSLICVQDFSQNGKILLNKNYWERSTTTSKMRNAFLNMDKKELMKKIKDGTAEIKNLEKFNMDVDWSE
jgi:hypothetical protein